MNPARLPVGRLCNLVYFWLVEHADAEGREKLDQKLFMPPPPTPGQAAAVIDEGPWSRDAEMAAFPTTVVRVRENDPRPAG